MLLPGLVFSLVALALKLAFPGEMSRQVGISVQELIHSYVYPNDNPMRELWFIATLFWLFLLTPLWKIVLKREWTAWGTMIVLAVLHFWHPDIELLCLGRVFSYGIWFYLGVVISKQDWVDNYLVKQPWLVLLSGIVAYVIGYFTIGFVTTLGGIVLSFGLALLLDKYLPRTFATFRDYTYQIFLMGIFAQMLVKIVYRHISLPYFPTYLVCIAVGLYVPVVISKIIEKINWKPLSLSVGLK